jgi:hypothetical protein
MSGQLHAPTTLPQRNSPQYPLDRRLGGPQNQSGQHGEEKKLAPMGTQTVTLRLSSPLPVTILTAVSQLLLYISSYRNCFYTNKYNYIISNMTLYSQVISDTWHKHWRKLNQKSKQLWYHKQCERIQHETLLIKDYCCIVIIPDSGRTLIPTAVSTRITLSWCTSSGQ